MSLGLRRGCAAVPLRRRRAAVPLRRWRTCTRLLEEGDAPSQRWWCRRCAFDSLCSSLASSLSHNCYHASCIMVDDKISNKATMTPMTPTTQIIARLRIGSARLGRLRNGRPDQLHLRRKHVCTKHIASYSPPHHHSLVHHTPLPPLLPLTIIIITTAYISIFTTHPTSPTASNTNIHHRQT